MWDSVSSLHATWSSIINQLIPARCTVPNKLQTAHPVTWKDKKQRPEKNPEWNALKSQWRLNPSFKHENQLILCSYKPKIIFKMWLCFPSHFRDAKNVTFQVLQPGVHHLLKVSFSKSDKLFHCTSLVRSLMKEKLLIAVLHPIFSILPLKVICRQLHKSNFKNFGVTAWVG